jgi:hypothetical protein
MADRWRFWSAVTVRLGMAAGCVLGWLAGYWIRAATAPGEDPVLTWPPVAGAVAGFAVACVGLLWLARWHKGAGVIAGAALVAGAAAALLVRYAGGG